MNRRFVKLFWSYDVVKTENWLKEMNAKGYALKKINYKLRLFIFEKVEPNRMYYRIVFDKKTNEIPQEYLENKQYKKVCYNKKYYVIKTSNDNLDFAPSYDGFLSKNRKIKFGVGIGLLFYLSLVLPFIIIFGVVILFSIITGNFSYESSTEPSLPPTTAELIEGTITLAVIFGFILLLIWSVYTFFKLKKTNKQLEKLCGDDLDLAFTIPKDTILSKEEIKRLRKNNSLLKKTKLAWHYSPDKVESWLEQMESEGYNLVQMSKLGVQFYFIKGKPRKIKYHVDYQNMTNPTYYNMNKDCGWKLYFTSITRIQSYAVWGQEYQETPPEFYSDSVNKLKNAKRIALTYSIAYTFICVLYILLLIQNINLIIKYGFQPMQLWFYFPFILIFEYGYFTIKTVLYYFRIKKSSK